jgi:tRNA A58 N-methylase Trm61
MDGTEELIITDEFIYTPHNKHIVMHMCETSIMKKQAEITIQNGGDILEIGFGMNISADFIVNNPNVTSYTVIEIHPQQYERALEWAKTKTIPINVILGDWYDILPLLDTKFDGIFFDTDTDKNYVDNFLNKVKSNCKDGTIVTFFTYYKFDSRLTPVRIVYTEEEFNNLPDTYKKNRYFNNKTYTFWYTKFNGTDFYTDGNIII